MTEHPVLDEQAVVAFYQRDAAATVFATARQFGLTKSRTSVILHRAGVMRPAGVRGKTKPAGVYAIAGGRLLRAARRAASLSQDELAVRAGTVQATISGLETRYGYGVSDELAHKLAVIVARPFSDLFTPVGPQSHVLGDQSAIPAPRVKRSEVRAAEAYAEANGWWTTRQAADYIHIDQGTLLHNYERYGYLTPTAEKRFGPLPFKFWDPTEVRTFAKGRWASDDPRVAVHRDPESAYRLALIRTGSEEAADDARKRATARGGKRKQVVAGRANAGKGGGIGGRKRGPKTKVSPEEEEQIRRLKREGLSYRSISEVMYGHARFKNRIARLF